VNVSSIMRELTALNAAEYLRDSGRVPDGATIDVRELTGGVSNIVLRADISGHPPIVIKQCRERLRVAMEWHARLERIWTEQAAMEMLGAILPTGTVPLVEFEDRPNYLFAMTCAPDDAVTWKSQLMGGMLDPDIAVRLGIVLATIHDMAPGQPALTTQLSRSERRQSTSHDADPGQPALTTQLSRSERRQSTIHDAAAPDNSLTGILADTSLFEELRVDPYYRTIARSHPDLKPQVDALIAAMLRPESERTLVLGDFSPKNILVHQHGLILLDFECAHSGDAAFDLGFFLTHLLLKRIRAEAIDCRLAPEYAGLATAFLNAYLDRRAMDATARTELTHRAILHTAACCLARVDGKSPVEYLDQGAQATARAFARESLRTEPRTWDALLELVDGAIERTNACRP
jgi:5-methylthioribose kinase